MAALNDPDNNFRSSIVTGQQNGLIEDYIPSSIKKSKKKSSVSP